MRLVLTDIDLLKFGLEHDPNSEMAWLNLGRAYEEDGQLEQARAALETAHRLAVQNGSPHLSIFVDAMNKIKQRAPEE